jgi:hypothetical protein
MSASGRERIAVVALAVLAPVLFWGCLEAGARLAGVRPIIEDKSYSDYVRQRDCQVDWRSARHACRPEVFEHGNRKLLVTLGGSSVHGYPKGRPSFAPKLGELLKRVAPGQWRVVNRGFACKNSTFAEQCAHLALAAGADVLVIYAGHNDYANYGVWNPSRKIWLERHAWLYDVEVGLARSRVFSALIGLLRSDAAPQWVPPQPAPEQVRAAQEVVREEFTRHLTSVIEAAAESRTRIVLSTVVSNIYEFPVKKADWDTSPLFDREARPDLAPWADHYQAGIARYRAGELESALDAFAAARDTFMRGRAPSMHNERVRELAAKYEHVELVDIERGVHGHLDEGVGCNFFGDDTYCDQFHPNDRTHEMIAGVLLMKLRAMGLVPKPPERSQ